MEKQISHIFRPDEIKKYEKQKPEIIPGLSHHPINTKYHKNSVNEQNIFLLKQSNSMAWDAHDIKGLHHFRNN